MALSSAGADYHNLRRKSQAKCKVDITKLKPITFDPAGNGYYVVGEKVGNAFKDGLALK